MNSIRCDEQDYLIWKWRPHGYSAESEERSNAIRWGSSLQVSDGSVAVFVYPQASGYEDFIEGPYSGLLETENLPVISNILGKIYDRGTPFQAEVYFINLAGLIQVKFGVPYFDVFDKRYKDLGVPVAVRGAITFKIEDYRHFIKLHRLDDFNLDQFKMQIRDIVVRYTKETVANAPEEYEIPVVQLERRIGDINDILEKKVSDALNKDFGVSVIRVDVSAIDLDKKSKAYRKLEAMGHGPGVALVHAAGGVIDAIYSRKAESRRMKDRMEKAEKDTEHIEKKASGKLLDAVSSFKHPDKKAAPPPLPIIQYFVAVNDEQTGPYGMDIIKQMIQAGTLTDETLVWKKGMKNWEKAGSIRELSSIIKSTEEEMPPDLRK